DEIWSYIYCKEKNVRHDLRGKGVAGDVWTWTAIDANTKLIISWHVGNREIDSGLPFMRDLAKRVINRIQLTTDGLHLYPNVVEEAFGARADYAYLRKSYGMEFGNKERRYSAQYIKSITKTIMSGSPDPDHISTSLVERQNLTMRMSMRRFTRLSNGFSKKLIYHKYMVALYFVYYNFCRIHSTIRVTPAMEAGLTNDILKIEDLIKLADN
ncbi:MAG TPA: IS1 family transposase, partial [Bacteroidia bacterium]|nr:IS1 family transposase [Bacteroidia bacterium]